jgi:hypothetical protein
VWVGRKINISPVAGSNVDVPNSSRLFEWLFSRVLASHRGGPRPDSYFSSGTFSLGWRFPWSNAYGRTQREHGGKRLGWHRDGNQPVADPDPDISYETLRVSFIGRKSTRYKSLHTSFFF